MKRFYSLSVKILFSTLIAIFGLSSAQAGDPLCGNIVNFTEVAEDSLDASLQYLEEVLGESAINWVEAQNEITASRLETDPRFQNIKDRILADLNSQEKLVIPAISGDEVIDFWRDAKNPKGIWRVATLDSYNKGKPNWKTVIDFDALSKQENENWIFKGTTRLKDSSRMIVSLSRDGKDAVVLREFDRKTGKFVKGGFEIPEGVGNSITWISEDEVLVESSTEGGDVTDSGYPISIRRLKRGQKLSKAPEIFRGEKKDIAVGAAVHKDSETKEVTDIFIYKSYSFNDAHMFRLEDDGSLTKVNKPENSSLSFVEEDAYIYLEQDTFIGSNQFPSDKGVTTFPAGTVLRADKSKFLDGTHKYEVVFQPDSAQAVTNWFIADDRILLVVAEDVNEKLVELKKGKNGFEQKVVVEPGLASISLVNTSREDGRVRYILSSFLEPDRYFDYNLKRRTSKLLDSEPERIDASKYQARQFFATSPDGTRVPYYMVAKKDVKFDGTNPALVYAYGGFKISRQPYYHDSQIKNWIDEGGVYVIANARGGGEYGPNWWRQALQENRYKSYEDIAAVAEELVHMKLSSPGKIAIHGGSNGGLMAGNLMVRNPDLFGAAIIEVPLLDMLRFHKLLRGASWQDEYGFPDNPKHVPHLRGISAYHQLDPNVSYPEPLFMTSTADDRVHPGHARKMASKMHILGMDALFYENREGGHGGASNYEQTAHGAALRYVYLLQKLADEPAAETSPGSVETF